MKKYMISMMLSMMLAIPAAQARNVKVMLPIADALDTPLAQRELDKKIPLEFGQKTVNAAILSEERVYKKKNRSTLTDKEVCHELFVTALKEMQDRAKSVGANTVTNIRSSYAKKAPIASTTQYECHTGRALAGVALTGEFINSASANTHDILKK
jgi:hypothetical protein